MILSDTQAILRKLCREIGAQVIAAMADGDVSVEDLAAELEVDRATVRRWLNRLIDGKPVDLRTLAELSWALDCYWKIELALIEQENGHDR